MKRLLILLTCFIFVFQACEKDEVLKPNETISDEIEFKVSDGILSFDSGTDFFALGEKLTALSNEELVRWENENGFISLQTEVEKAFEILERCETVEEFNEVMSKNADIIKDEDDYIMPVIRSIFHSVIANRDGYYIVEDVLYKVTSEGVYSCNTKSTELIENAISSGLHEDNQEVNFLPSLQSREENSILKSTGGVTSVSDESAWTNNRSCKAAVWIDEVWYGWAPDNVTFNYYTRCYSYAQGLTWLGKTKLYRSRHFTNGLTVKYNAPIELNTNYMTFIVYGEQIKTLAAQGPSSPLQTMRYWDETDHQLGNTIVMTQAQIDQIGSPTPTITYANGRFWTEGTGSSIYAELSFD